MLNRLEARGRALAESRRREAATRVRNGLATVLPDAEVRPGVEGVTIAARGLVRRWFGDARLRWPAEWLR